MSNLSKLKRDLFFKSKEQKNAAWVAKNYDEQKRIREEEQKVYEKWQLLDGIMRANEKGKKENGNKR